MLKLAKILVGVLCLPYLIYAAEFNRDYFETQLNKLKSQAKFKNVRLGIAISALPDGQTLFLSNETQDFMPASTLKLILSAAALHFYQPDSCFRTPVYQEGVLQDGVLTGNIYLKGIGAPNILLDSLDQAILRLKRQGLKEVRGNILYDDQAFAPQEPRFPPYARDRWAPGGALVLNSNRIELKVKSQTAPIELEAYPKTAYANINANLKYANTDNPSSPEMRYQIEPDGDRFTLSGTVTRWTERTNYLALGATRPGLLFATVFKERLAFYGIRVTGQIRAAACPEGLTRLGEILSPPLRQMVLEMNTASDNIIAENLFRKIGLDQTGAPADAKKAGLALKRFVQSILPGSQLVCADGSGLSPDSRISPATFMQLLVHFNKNNAKLLQMLPEEGVSTAKFKVKGKSGTLSARGLNALAGYILADATGAAFAFVILAHREPNTGKLWSGTLTHPIMDILLQSLK